MSKKMNINNCRVDLENTINTVQKQEKTKNNTAQTPEVDFAEEAFIASPETKKWYAGYYYQK